MKRNTLALTLAAVLVAASGAAQARHADLMEPGHVSLSAPVGKKASPELVHKAIREAATRTGWTVRDDTPGKITLRHNKGSHEAMVDVSYDAAGYEIRYVSSSALDYKLKDGKAQIHPLYNTWVNDLQRQIDHAYAR